MEAAVPSRHGAQVWEGRLAWTYRQAVAAGLTDRDVRRLVRTGTWCAPYRGCFVAGPDPSAEALAAAACLTVGPDAVAVLESAAAVHGLAVRPRAREAVAVARRAGRRSREGLLVVQRAVPPAATMRRGGLAITTTAYAAADLAHASAPPDRLAVLDRALARGADRAEIARWAATLQHPRRVLQPLAHASPLPESPPESHLRHLVLTAGLPRPTPQLPVVDPRTGRVRCRLDLGLARWQVGLEYDGVAFHTGDALARDRARANWLLEQGWAVVGVTAGMLYGTPEVLVGQVRQVLRARGADV